MIHSHEPSKPSMPVTMARSIFPDDDIKTFQREAALILRDRVSMGRWVENFQAVAAEAHGVSYAMATNSCTSALEVALMAVGVGRDDEVLVPVQTFIATGMAVHNIGARPVFCDINPITLCLDPSEIEKRASKKVKAVVLVHFAGLITPDIEEIKAACRLHGWALIEDAAHAHGASYKGRSSGSLGDAGCFSYYPTKILTTGEGGMIVTNDKSIADISASYQYRGQDLNAGGEVFARPYGRNIRMPELSALLGVLQYGRLEEFVAQRRKVASVYDETLAGHPSIQRQAAPQECLHSYWLYPVILPSGVDRSELKRRCQVNWEITIDWSYYPALHLMPVFQDLYGTAPGMLPVAEDLLERIVCLPIHPAISMEDAQAVIDCFTYEFNKLQREQRPA